MTLYHFGNCLALVYAPYYMTYKFSGLSEYGAFWKCVQAGFIYVFTQLCKMLVLATLFDSDSTSGEDFNFFARLLYGVFDVADLLGFYLILKRNNPGKGHSKLITTGLGYATAEVILSRGIMLWVGARGTEFSWIYIQKCLESNVLLIQHITTATLVWLFTRNDLNKTFKPLVTLLLALTIFKGVWLEGLLNLLAITPWASIAMKFFVAALMGVTTLHIYTGLAQQIGI